MGKSGKVKSVALGFVKIITLIIATLIVQQICFIPLALISKTFWAKYDGRGLNEPWFLSTGIVIFLVSLLICWLCVKFIDKKKFSYIRLTSTKIGKYISTGLLASFILVGIFTLVNVLVGNTGLSVVYRSFLNAFFYMLVLAVGILALAMSEELIYRGYILKTLENNFNFIIAAIISSLLFSIAHFVRPDASLLAFINIFLSGIILSLICIYYNSLWVPIGIHFGWNYFLWFFNYPVSDQRWTNPMFKLVYNKENLVSGSKFGPEDSILLTIILVIAIAYFLSKFKAKTGHK